jgi:hypothetical protein
MALLTDGNPNDTEALRIYETAILSVANVEMIDLDAKLGLATEEISDNVLDILLDHTRAYDPQSNIRRMIGVSDVAVTPQLKRWQAAHTLEIVYRDAFNNQLNDRYKPKWDEYRELSRAAREQTERFGIGLVLSPVPKAAAPILSVVPGTTAATTYYVQVSWVSAAAQEGSPSDLTAFETAGGSQLVAQAVQPPAIATGWNVYIGLTDATVTLQNGTPIPVGQTFTLPSSGLVNGRPPGNGQAPDVYVTGGRMLRRG